MTKSRLRGIRRALRLGKDTGVSVNVALIKNGESKKIEGLIRRVGKTTFRIRLEDTGRRKIEKIRRVEYVEYS